MSRSALAALERLRLDFGPEAATRKRRLLRALVRSHLGSAGAVRRLHEALCFLRAYPDDASLLAQVNAMLGRFDRRVDLRRHRDALADSGIAGTAIHYRFFAGQAQWLAQRWPGQLRLDRDADPAAEARIAQALPALLGAARAQAFTALKPSAYAAIDALRARDVSDAVYLLRLVAAMPGDGYTREVVSDTIDASYMLAPGPGTPSRTTAHWSAAPIVLRERAPPLGRPALAAELARAPHVVRRLAPPEAREIVELARGAMVTRARSLEAFSFANEDDVWWVDDGDGLAYAFAGVVPERRHALASIYGGLTLRNGVPIGYHQADLLGPRAALSFNTFETFRGAEAAYSFVRWLAALHHLFGTRSFSIEPYQLGKGNDEAIDSGAWWFYAKLGFAPRDAATQRLAHAETARLARAASRRTAAATLQRLAQHHLYFEADPSRPCTAVALEALLWSAGVDTAPARRLAQRCGIMAWRGWSAAQREAWNRVAPMFACLGVARWPELERRALGLLMRAKAGRGEREFLRHYAALPRLDAALVRGPLNRGDSINQT